MKKVFSILPMSLLAISAQAALDGVAVSAGEIAFVAQHKKVIQKVGDLNEETIRSLSASEPGHYWVSGELCGFETTLIYSKEDPNSQFAHYPEPVDLEIGLVLCQ